MNHEELMGEATRLATQSVENGWGGPFGAVIVKDGEIVARGQNRVLLTGDPTAHAEVESIRKAIQVLNPEGPTIAPEEQDLATLELVPRPEGSPDRVPKRAKMLMGYSIYTAGIPCPMCMSAIYWSRISDVYYANDLAATQRIGFDDAYQYEDFSRPMNERGIHIEQVCQEVGATAYAAWNARPDRHPY
ncbi:CMP/dCMP deaminase zinc-binding [Parafrankia sp. EAN1pec]|uniref:nucleoside deaminase n=1 Tax=Parafrankia sp. (strain EAN1pec) TaxID=298653 RepID=UPI0000543B17|nr:CMP/dCMP deaminase zinc-binding [Frankia sp. EAN1pec]